MVRAPILLSVLALSGCGVAMQQVSPAEQQRAAYALQPSSQAAIEHAVVTYFSDILVDPDSAKFRLLPPMQGHVIRGTFYDQNRMFGWFVCGTVNAKNRMGGYAGQSEFFAYFNPARRDEIAFATIDRPGAERAATNSCQDVYRS